MTLVRWEPEMGAEPGQLAAPTTGTRSWGRRPHLGCGGAEFESPVPDITFDTSIGKAMEQQRDDHTMGVILAISVVGVVLGLLLACGLALVIGWWFRW